MDSLAEFSTLHKRWLPSLIFSPSGRDKSEGASCGNPFFRSLLEAAPTQAVSEVEGRSDLSALETTSCDNRNGYGPTSRPTLPGSAQQGGSNSGRAGLHLDLARRSRDQTGAPPLRNRISASVIRGSLIESAKLQGPSPATPRERASRAIEINSLLAFRAARVRARTESFRQP
jgi:hypothetical protein